MNHRLQTTAHRITAFQAARIVAAVCVCSVLAIGAAMARPHGGMLAGMDADKDGSVSRQEMAAHGARAAAQLDADGDGSVSFQEMQAHRERQREQRARARFERLDSDGDGTVSVAEFQARVERRFARLDANDDGEITREELKAMRHARRGDRQGKGAHDGD